jgi:hypothetical protein
MRPQPAASCREKNSWFDAMFRLCPQEADLAIRPLPEVSKWIWKIAPGGGIVMASEHYRALHDVHAPPLQSIERITGRPALFIQWNLTGPAQPQAGQQVRAWQGSET